MSLAVCNLVISISLDPLGRTVICNSHWNLLASWLQTTDRFILPENKPRCQNQANNKVSMMTMWRSDVYHLLPNYKLQITANKMQRFLNLLIFTDAPRFRRFLHPSSGAHNCTYSFRYCQPILPLAATVEMELHGVPSPPR